MTPIMKLLLIAISLLSAGDRWLDSFAPVDPYAALPGAWGWEGTSDCTVSPQKIRFSADRKQMMLSLTPTDEHGTRAARREVTYAVLRDLPNGLRLALEGESRMDAAGKPVTWDLILRGSNEFCWHRGDWPGTGCTKSMDRCPGING
ncbi:hypothetical protein [Dyella sp.]|jgi:hypothetical protein|uniref:hypothetical protein n=1 Tax=Dyella sp. TaxID=1869338 RepID=UPI002D77149D|nr:hypothetical protein [Dyella sp.]HET6432895.1 hypothetical protein [Dyella sp.]